MTTPLREYACSCGRHVLMQRMPPHACSRCPQCGTQLTDAPEKPAPLAHVIREGVCETCARPAALLLAVGAGPRMVVPSEAT